MTEAIFGLVGVVIGALISGGVSYVLEKRKENLAARVAARLVRDDLYLAACWMEDALRAGKWIQNPASRINTRSWSDQRSQLAAVMNYDEYAKVGDALSSATRINNWLDATPADLNLDEKKQQNMKRQLADLGNGLAVLKKYAQ